MIGSIKRWTICNVVLWQTIRSLKFTNFLNKHSSNGDDDDHE